MTDAPIWAVSTGDYLSDTIHLDDPALHGAYLLLMMALWRTSDTTLPDDPSILARICRCRRERFTQHIWPRISDLFDTNGERIWQARVTDDRSALEVRLRAKREAGSKGGIATALKRHKTAVAHGTNLPAAQKQQTSNNTAAIPSPSPKEEKEKEKEIGLVVAPARLKRQPKTYTSYKVVGGRKVPLDDEPTATKPVTPSPEPKSGPEPPEDEIPFDDLPGGEPEPEPEPELKPDAELATEIDAAAEIVKAAGKIGKPKPGNGGIDWSNIENRRAYVQQRVLQAHLGRPEEIAEINAVFWSACDPSDPDHSAAVERARKLAMGVDATWPEAEAPEKKVSFPA